MDRAALAQELRWLVAFATDAGADPARVAAVSSALVDLLLERTDPRTRRTETLAARVARAHAAGVNVPALMERFGISRPSVYRLIRVSRLRETHARSNELTRQPGE